MTKKVLLLENIHPAAVKRLEEVGIEVDTEDKALQGKDLIERAQGYSGLGIRSKTNVTTEVLDGLSDLDVLGAFCIGTNQVELDRANACGVPVFNAPYSNTRSVAELVISEMIALSRQWSDRSAQAHKGQWTKSAKGSNEVRGKKLGIVGYGHIGSQLSVLAESMGFHVFYYDIIKVLPLGNANPLNSLEDILRTCDFVSLHVPETPDTKNMMGEKELAMMKHGSYLINASRGTVVEIQALAAAIESGHLGGAAVDVFPVEPGSNSEEFKSELQGLPNVILTPHIGGSTEEAQEKIGLEVAESLVRYFSAGSSFGSVNFPQLDVPLPKEAPRILNVHKNVPGVLGSINGIVSELGGNIRAQYLATDPNIGYLIFDMGRGDVEAAAEKIASLDTSIRTNLIHP